MQSGLTRTDVLVAAAIAAVIAAIAVPGLRRSRMSGNEAAAIGSLRAVVSAQAAYASACGQNRYAVTLPALGRPAPGGSQGFLAPGLAAATPELSGYRFRLAPADGSVPGPADCHGAQTSTGYYASATPVRFGASGARAFAVDTAGMVWQTPAAAAPVEPFAAPATPIQ